MKRAFVAGLLFFPLGAAAAENALPPASAYRSVMQAQYAARTPAVPMPAEEARRVYENYLQSTGQKPVNRSAQSGTEAGNKPR